MLRDADEKTTPEDLLAYAREKLGASSLAPADATDVPAVITADESEHHRRYVVLHERANAPTIRLGVCIACGVPVGEPRLPADRLAVRRMTQTTSR